MNISVDLIGTSFLFSKYIVTTFYSIRFFHFNFSLSTFLILITRILNFPHLMLWLATVIHNFNSKITYIYTILLEIYSNKQRGYIAIDLNSTLRNKMYVISVHIVAMSYLCTIATFLLTALQVVNGIVFGFDISQNWL